MAFQTGEVLWQKPEPLLFIKEFFNHSELNFHHFEHLHDFLPMFDEHFLSVQVCKFGVLAFDSVSFQTPKVPLQQKLSPQVLRDALGDCFLLPLVAP